MQSSFSPDSSTLANAQGTQSVGLWKVDSGEKIALLTGHSRVGEVLLPFLQMDVALISGGDDETLRIWDVTPYRATPEGRYGADYLLSSHATVACNQICGLNLIHS